MQKITVLHTLNCPNFESVLSELAEIEAMGIELEISTVEITTEDFPSMEFFHGSPTVLIDGEDRFPYDTKTRSLACRIYFDEETKKPVGAPTRDMLLTALAKKAYPL